MLENILNAGYLLGPSLSFTAKNKISAVCGLFNYKRVNEDVDGNYMFYS